MKSLVLLLLLVLCDCASPMAPPAELEDYSRRLTAYYAAQARELPNGPVLRRVQAITSIANRVDPYAIDLVKGREVYRTRCASCHGAHGEGAQIEVQAYGNVVTGPLLDRRDIQEEYSVGAIAYVAGEAWAYMTPVGQMTDVERWQVAEFVKSGRWLEPKESEVRQ